MAGIAFDLATKRLLTWTVPAGVSAMVNDLLTDTMYHATATEVLPQFQGAEVTGRWKSKRIVLDDWPGFAWMRLEGPFTSALVRLYSNGALFHTVTVTSNEPVRLPAGRAREWEIDIEASSIVTEICLATTAEEMRAA